MKHRFVPSSGVVVSGSAMVTALAWCMQLRREWRITEARRQAYREIALLPESLRTDLAINDQKM